MSKPRSSLQEGKWSFDPDRAVDLIFGAAPRFQFELVVQTYLFLVWVVAPNLRRSLNITASALALEITCSKQVDYSIAEHYIWSSKRIVDLDEFVSQLKQPWYREFYDNFVAKVGGLAPASAAISLASLDKIRRKRYHEDARALALIDYYAKAISFDRRLLKRKYAQKAFEVDVLNKGAHFYRSEGNGKRSAEATRVEEQTQIEGKKSKSRYTEGMGSSTFGDLLKKTDNQIILLYSLSSVLGSTVDKFFVQKRLLSKLSGEDVIEQLQRGLEQYERIISELEGVSGKSKFFKDWRSVKIKNSCGLESLPQFNSEQIKRATSVLPIE